MNKIIDIFTELTNLSEINWFFSILSARRLQFFSFTDTIHSKFGLNKIVEALTYHRWMGVDEREVEDM